MLKFKLTLIKFSIFHISIPYPFHSIIPPLFPTYLPYNPIFRSTRHHRDPFTFYIDVSKNIHLLRHIRPLYVPAIKSYTRTPYHNTQVKNYISIPFSFTSSLSLDLHHGSFLEHIAFTFTYHLSLQYLNYRFISILYPFLINLPSVLAY